MIKDLIISELISGLIFSAVFFAVLFIYKLIIKNREQKNDIEELQEQINGLNEDLYNIQVRLDNIENF